MVAIQRFRMKRSHALISILALLLAACGGGASDSSPFSESSPTVASAETTDTGSTPGEGATGPEVSEPGITWTRIPHNNEVFGGEGDQRITAVVAGGPGLVAVGWDDDAAAVWTSPDGLRWDRVNDAGSFEGPGSFGMRAVTQGGPGLVGVGFAGIGTESDAAVWVSTDGRSWDRVESEVLGGEFAQEMNAIAVDNGTLVAGGWDGGFWAMWTSPDGLIWERDDPEVFSEDYLLVNDVLPSGPGFIAVGEAGAGYGETSAAVWTSEDGSAWSRVPHDEYIFGGPNQQTMTGIVSGDSSLTAVGWDIDGFGIVWTSPDGVTWSRVADTGGNGLGGGLLSVAVSDGRLFTIGWSGEDSMDTLWASDDGAAWTVVTDEAGALGAEAELLDLVATESGLVLVGSVGPPFSGDAAVWVADL